MAYTILATWDFRTTDSATARTSRRNPSGGPYVLTASGSPSYTVNGVSIGSGADLRLNTTPAELRPANECGIICGFRRNDVPVNNQDHWISYFWDATASAAPFFSPFSYQYGSSTTATIAMANGGTYRGASVSSGIATLDADIVYTLQRESISELRLYEGASTTVQSLSGATAWHPYDTTATLVFGRPHRFAWAIMYSGTLSQAERTAIIATPDDFIYPAPSGPAFRSYYITG